MMNTLLLVARLLLAAVFVVAGLTKLADRAGSRQALIGFGIPPVLATPLGIVLPLVELAVALALLPAASAWWGALSALALLLVFVVGIGYNLVRGRTPDCHCFGQLHSAPVGWPTLIRNALLAAVAVIMVWWGWPDAGPSAISWLADLPAAQAASLVFSVLVLVLVAAESWFLLHLMRQNGRLLLRIEAVEARVAIGAAAHAPAPAPEIAGLPIGAPAPAFALNGLFGETLTLDSLRAAGKPVMLVFSDPGCGPCNTLLPQFARWQREYASRLTVALISRGVPEENRAKVTEHEMTYVLLQKNREVAEAYRASGTPTAVIVQPDGMIGSPLAPGADAIAGLVARTVGAPLPAKPAPAPTVASNGNGNGVAAAPARPVTLPIGTPAPALRLPDLDGKMVDLADFRGHSTLLLFWNPSCGFCQRTLEELKAWETAPPYGAPKLLVVSTGTLEDNRVMGLRSPVVLDQNFNAGRAFGANGTPMAILIDAKGNIASEVAAGAPTVLALAAGKEQIKLTSK
jgi:peroxiredoxin